MKSFLLRSLVSRSCSEPGVPLMFLKGEPFHFLRREVRGSFDCCHAASAVLFLASAFPLRKQNRGRESIPSRVSSPGVCMVYSWAKSLRWAQFFFFLCV